MISFSAARSKLVAEKRITFADGKLIDFSRTQVRKKELQKGVLRICSSAVNELSARAFISQVTGVDNDKLDENNANFSYRMPELRPLGFVGAMERVIERLRTVIKPELREAFDSIAAQDIAQVRKMLDVDTAMFIMFDKFTNFLYSMVDEICNPKTELKILIDVATDSNDTRHVRGGTPLSNIYRKHRVCLINLDQNGKVGMPTDRDGIPRKHSGGSCVSCSLHTRKDITHVAVCPDSGKPDHIIGCPICSNDPSHGLLTCPVICRVTSRSYKKNEKIDDYVKYFEDHPLSKKGYPKGSPKGGAKGKKEQNKKKQK